MKKKEASRQDSPGGWNNGTYFQQRLKSFSWTMIVMGISFFLYYLGFFGNVEGPLEPARLGKRIAGMGVTKTHIEVIFLSLTMISISWNWIYNLAARLIGLRPTCTKKTGDENIVCGALATREKIVDKKTGRIAPQYVCEHGHKRPDAHFHPVKKGTVSHTVWVISLLFCIIVFYSSYLTF